MARRFTKCDIEFKYLVLIILLLYPISKIECQELPSLNETINYLQNKLSGMYLAELKEDKNHYSDCKEINSAYLSIYVSNSGKITLIYNWEMTVARQGTEIITGIETVSFFPGNLEIAANRNFGPFCDLKPNKILYRCKNYEACIEIPQDHYNDGRIAYEDCIYFNYSPGEIDKIKNALNHLFNLASAKAKLYEEQNPDAFSDSNYKALSGLGPISVPISKNTNGLFGFQIKIGSIEIKGFLDSGASNIVISKELLERLIINKAVDEKSDLTYAMIANGDIIATYTHNAQSVKIGDATINDVTISAIDDAPYILIGQSFLKKFKKWEIDNDKNILTLFR